LAIAMRAVLVLLLALGAAGVAGGVEAQAARASAVTVAVASGAIRMGALVLCDRRQRSAGRVCRR
jgi:hypothetical protein